MKLACWLTFVIVVAIVVSVPAQPPGNIFVRLEKIEGLRGADTLNAGDTIRFHIMYGNRDECRYNLSNAFRIYSRASTTSGGVGSGTATWVTVPPVNRPFGVNLISPSTSHGIQVDTTGYLHKSEFGGIFNFGCFSCDGSGADTVSLSAARSNALQKALGPYDSGIVFVIWIVTNAADTGKTICIDSSSNYPPTNTWKWPNLGPPSWCWTGFAGFPTWSGARCFTLAPYDCCLGKTGNLDCDAADLVDISDLTTIIDFLYLSHTLLCCNEQANCDGQPGIDIGDLTALIDHLYISFSPLTDCQ